ncbi:hypothetical protein GE09DRAFT_692267 [Coniochaeta sp. 2T2.1]|nr:hypothetical protein GE09DRAFT_692267 [Coniochaeta sp. 2T2.1]
MTDDYPVLDQQTVLDRLYPERTSVFKVEEQLHPWRARYSQSFQEPLLRIWDRVSGSNPTKDGRMISRAPEMRLDNAEARQASLAKHLDHSDWTPGPYISFTTSPAMIETLVRMRVDKRGAQTLTVIDPNIRIRNGLPVLDLAAEMDYYNIPDPYGKSKEYYLNHHVCLWQVTKAEIVDHWDWASLAGNEYWYQEISIPAFETFAARKRVPDNGNSLATELGAVESADENMDDLQIALDKLFVNEVLDDSDDSDRPDAAFGYHLEGEYDWDSDDSAAEANAADDIIKIIEGDW